MAGIYIHIPFCRKACTYCDFHFSTSVKTKDDILQAILLEASQQKHFFGPGLSPLQSVYFGGGTPSILSASQLELILHHLRSLFPISPQAEITLEANPDDLHPRYLNAIRQAGINRLSIGVQSFSDQHLQWMNRTHSAAQSLAAVRHAARAGFTSISLDLIFNIPGLSLQQWLHSLSIVQSLPVSHLSAYALTVEPKTLLSHLIKTHKSPAPGDEAFQQQFTALMQWSARAGFSQYEISNFARANAISIHNLAYWTGKPYLGLGPSAHSFNGITRSWNIANNPLYMQGIRSGRPARQSEHRTTATIVNEYLLTSLRLAQGADLSAIRPLLQPSHLQAMLNTIRSFSLRGWITQHNHTITLTPQGRLFADRIARDLFI